MADRVIVFIDYQNVHGWARRRFKPVGANPAQGHIDPLRTARHIVGRRNRPSDLTQVRVYRGRPNPEHQPGSTRANDRQTAEWERSGLVEVIRRNLKYPRDWPDSPATEKGIDVAIAVDMIRLAHAGAMDVAVLFSSDTDLLPALEALRDLDLCHVEVACWSKGNRLRYDGTQLPWCHSISASQYATLEDPVDYAAMDY